MAEFFKGLLGDKLQGKNGAIDTHSISGEGKTVGIYFSAHWCPPCRGFTPKLVEFYKKLHSDKKFEIVFVSSDKSDKECEEYYKEMPWLVLPYADRDRKDSISKKYKVSGIPTLVLLDGKDGKVITKDARAMLLDDLPGENFPWRPKGIKDILKDVKLVNNKKEEKSFDDLAGKVIGFYFSAHWCPPCKGFTPKLAETYNKIVEQGKPFEIIFVSSDRGQEGFDEYFKDMPWLSVEPYNDEKGKALSRHFGVQGIPTLILVDENRKIISSNGRTLISNDTEGENFPWKPKPLSALDEMTVSTVNDEACLIYFTDGEEASIKKAQDIIKPVAEKFFKVAKEKDEDPPVFFFYTKGDETSDSLCEFAQIPDDDNLLVILDIPSQNVYISEEDVLTREGVEKFVMDFTNNKLEGKKLRG